MGKEVKKAIVPAAGLGTRFLPVTKAQPKEMLPIVDKPAIQFIIEEAIASGIEDILIITGKHKRAIEDHFDKSLELEAALQEKGQQELLDLVQEISNLVDIYYVRQKELRGLGHAVYCARKFVGNEPFAVLLGDDIIDSEAPCLKQMQALYAELEGGVIAVQEVSPAEVERYGIIKGTPLRENLYRVEDVVEKPPRDLAPSLLGVVGRYVLEPEIFEVLGRTPPGAGGEIQLTDALKEIASRRPLYAYIFEGKRYDIGDKLGFLQATVEFALKRKELGAEFCAYLEKVVKEYKKKVNYRRHRLK